MIPYMNTTTHVFGAGGVVFSGRSGNTKLYPILSYPILSYPILSDPIPVSTFSFSLN